MVPPGYDNIPKTWNTTKRIDTILGTVMTIIFVSKLDKINLSNILKI